MPRSLNNAILGAYRYRYRGMLIHFAQGIQGHPAQNIKKRETSEHQSCSKYVYKIGSVRMSSCYHFGLIGLVFCLVSGNVWDAELGIGDGLLWFVWDREGWASGAEQFAEISWNASLS